MRLGNKYLALLVATIIAATCGTMSTAMSVRTSQDENLAPHENSSSPMRVSDEDKTVMLWAQRTAIKIRSYDFVNIEKQFKEASEYFTTESRF